MSPNKILLESYLQEIAQTIDALELSMEDVAATEKLVTFRLDAARNRLLKVEVAATAVGTAMGIGAVTTGMLGMNLKTPLFDSDEFNSGWTFNAAVPSITLLCFTVSTSMICFLYCPARRLRACVRGLCCATCRPRDVGSNLPKLPSHDKDSTLRRLISSVKGERGDSSHSRTCVSPYGEPYGEAYEAHPLDGAPEPSGATEPLVEPRAARDATVSLHHASLQPPDVVVVREHTSSGGGGHGWGGVRTSPRAAADCSTEVGLLGGVQ